MNKNLGKFLGIAVAVGGVAASIGTSFALYQRLPANVNIGIGSYTPTTDAFVYRLGTVSETAGTITPGTTTGYTKTDKLSFDLGGAYPNSGSTVIAQNFYVGYLTIDIYSDVFDTDKYVTDVITPTISFDFKSTSAHKDETWYVNKVTEVAEPTAGHKTYTGHIAFATGSTNDVDVEVSLAFNFDTDAKAFAYANKTYNVDIKLEEATETNNFKWLYIRDDKNGWTTSTDYRLVPNLGSSTAEFMFQNLPGDTGGMKIANSDWSCEAAADGGGNFNPAHSESTDIYQVYWHGAMDDTTKKVLTESESESVYYINANNPK